MAFSRLHVLLPYAGNSLVASAIFVAADATQQILDRKAVDSRLTQQAVDSRLTQQAVDSRLTQQAVDSSLTQQTVDNSLTQQTVDSSLTQQRADSWRTQQAVDGRVVLDYDSLQRMCVVGALFGPLSYLWHGRIELLIPGMRLTAVMRKSLITTAVAGAFFNGLFYVATSFLERKEDIFADAREKWLKTYLTSWVYWPFANALNLRLSPPHMRGIIANFFGYVWTVILCVFKKQPLPLEQGRHK